MGHASCIMYHKTPSARRRVSEPRNVDTYHNPTVLVQGNTKGGLYILVLMVVIDRLERDGRVRKKRADVADHLQHPEGSERVGSDVCP